MKQLYPLIALLLLGNFSFGQCVDCVPDDSCISEVQFPQLCPEVAPAATAGEYYEETMTFFMPAQLVDPDSEVTVDLLSVTINQVTGLPFGLTFQLSEEDNTYNPGDGQTLGCATICGTPLLPGEYSVTVLITAEVSFIGFPSTVNESFSQPLTVLPGEGGNASFSIDNLASCDSLVVDPVALIDGSPGITEYSWDFGNGFGSNEADPDPITYNESGDYTISLTTTISDYILQSVSVTSFDDNWAGDVEEFTTNFAPDPFFVLTDGSNNPVYTSSVLTDVFGASWTDLGIVLNNPPYTIAFYDEDLISATDFLGSGGIGLNEGINPLSAGGTSGFVGVEIGVTAEFLDEEQVSVFPTPEPGLGYDEENDLLELSGEDLDTFLWFLNGDTLNGAITQAITPVGPGVYQAQAVNIYGCSGYSNEWIICPDPQISWDEELDLMVTEEGFASYEWSYNGLPVPDSDSSTLPFQGLGNYAVEISTDYGCTVESSVFSLLTVVSEQSVSNFSIYPNPASSFFQVEGMEGAGTFGLMIFDMKGRLVMNLPLVKQGDKIDIGALLSGVYSVQLYAGELRSQRSLIILH